MILKDIWLDVKAVQERDPAARSALEVLLLYQGVHALIWHRFAHWFYKHRLFFIARLISQIARFFTLIEIHPGAEMGHGILIDHGCGVVIGETTIVGDNCTIYQGVTLGGVGLNKGKRHPTLGRNVTVGAGAKILGAFEVGDNCTIAANAVLLKPLDNDTTAVGVPARPIKVAGVPIEKKEEPKTTIYYVTDEQQQSQYINMFRSQRQDAVILNHNIDSPFITQLEQRNQNIQFQRIDADITESAKEEVKEEEKENFQKTADTLTEVFKKALDNDKLNVKVEKLKDDKVASMITLSEQSRRMQEMMKMYGMTGMDPSMFGTDSTLTLNANHPLVQFVVENKDNENVPVICKQLYDLAMLAHKPLSPEEMTAFVQRSNDIMMLLTK